MKKAYNIRISPIEKVRDMYAQMGKAKENKSRSVANYVAQKKSNGKQGFGFVVNCPDVIAQQILQEKSKNETKLAVFQRMESKLAITKQREGEKLIQARFYQPLPDGGQRWNELLVEIETLHEDKPLPNKDDIDDFIAEAEVEWDGTDDHSASIIQFNAFFTLKSKVKSGLRNGKIDTNDARNVGWDEILPVIRRIEDAGYCTVNINENVPYDSGTGVTWRVDDGQGYTQRGGWKNNAMTQGNLEGALGQVRTAIGYHNDAIDRQVLRDIWSE